MKSSGKSAHKQNIRIEREIMNELPQIQESHQRVSESINAMNYELMKIKSQQRQNVQEYVLSDEQNSGVMHRIGINDSDRNLKAKHFNNQPFDDDDDDCDIPHYVSVKQNRVTPLKEDEFDEKEEGKQNEFEVELESNSFGVTFDVEAQNKEESLIKTYGEQSHVNELARSLEILLRKNAMLENELSMLRRRGSSENSIVIPPDRQLQVALIEKIRLEEMVEFMREEGSRMRVEVRLLESKVLELEAQAREQSDFEIEVQKSAQVQLKRIEEQLKTSNFNFVTAQRKIDGLERINKDLAEKLALLEQEKKKISLKWAAASQKGKIEEKLKCRVKELESELAEKVNESEEFKKKYVSTNTELRVFKEGEYNYKDFVEQRFKDVRERLNAEIYQKDELLKQNKELLGQLSEFSSEFTRLSQKVAAQSSMDSMAIKAHGGEQSQAIGSNGEIGSKSYSERSQMQQQQEEENSSRQLSRVTEVSISASEFEEGEVQEIEGKLRKAENDISELTMTLKESEMRLSNLQGENTLLTVQIKKLGESLSFQKDSQRFKNEQQHQQMQPQQELMLTFNSNMYHSFLSSLSILCNVELFEAFRHQLNSLILEQVRLFETNLCKRCLNPSMSSGAQLLQTSNVVTGAAAGVTASSISGDLTYECNQNSFEAKYLEIKQLYDRLLVKHLQMQQEKKYFESSMMMHSTDRSGITGYSKSIDRGQMLTSSESSSPCTTNQRISHSFSSSGVGFSGVKAGHKLNKSIQEGLSTKDQASTLRNDGKFSDAQLNRSSQKVLSQILSRSFESTTGGGNCSTSTVAVVAAVPVTAAGCCAHNDSTATIKRSTKVNVNHLNFTQPAAAIVVKEVSNAESFSPTNSKGNLNKNHYKNRSHRSDKRLAKEIRGSSSQEGGYYSGVNLEKGNQRTQINKREPKEKQANDKFNGNLSFLQMKKATEDYNLLNRSNIPINNYTFSHSDKFAY